MDEVASPWITAAGEPTEAGRDERETYAELGERFRREVAALYGSA